MRSKSGSLDTPAMICKPIGNPERVKPQGTETAGTPARFAGRL
jgi:hypothetical protein